MGKQRIGVEMLEQEIVERQCLAAANTPFSERDDEFTKGYLHACLAVTTAINDIKNNTCGDDWDEVKFEVYRSLEILEDSPLPYVLEYGEPFICGFREFLLELKDEDIPMVEEILNI